MAMWLFVASSDRAPLARAHTGGTFYFFFPPILMNTREGRETGADTVTVMAPAAALNNRELLASMDLLKQKGLKVRLEIADRFGRQD